MLGLLACGVRWMVEGPRRHRQRQQQREARRLAAVQHLPSQPDLGSGLGGAVVPLVVTGGLCTLLAMILVGPDWGKAVAGICIALALPVGLTTMLVYARAYLRTFCIGALVPAGASLLVYQFSFYFMRLVSRPGGPGDEALLFVIATGIIWGMSVGVGLIACGARWMFEEPRRRQQREAVLQQQDRVADELRQSP